MTSEHDVPQAIDNAKETQPIKHEDVDEALTEHEDINEALTENEALQ